jgi:hypothetical protein
MYRKGAEKRIAANGNSRPKVGNSVNTRQLVAIMCRCYSVWGSGFEIFEEDLIETSSPVNGKGVSTR